jgi:probable F420-dependent oxidoreductase
LRVGIHLPQTGPLASPQAVRLVAQEAERAGWTSVWAGDRLVAPITPRPPWPDHLMRWADDSAGLDPLMTLALAAAVTTRIKVGTSVLAGPWYPPVLLARSLASLDQLSGGRLVAGFGLGRSLDDHDAAGTGEGLRRAHLEELLDALDAMWGADPISFDGRRARVAPAHAGPIPVQQPRPPVLLAATTPAGLDRVARRADGWMPNGLPVEAIGPMWRAVRDLASGHGRDPDLLRLVARASVTVCERPQGADRPSYCGTVEQVACDLDATRRQGADEVILALAPGDAGELVEVAAALVQAADLR